MPDKSEKLADLANLVNYPIQIQQAESGVYLTGTTLLPHDDTIPQITEGNAVSALDTTITPTSATNKLRIDVTLFVEHSVATSNITVALFQDSNANALACSAMTTGNGGSQPLTITFTHWMTAGTTSPTTFKVRAGSSVAGTVYVNGNSTGRLYGGVLASSVTVTEIKA